MAQNEFYLAIATKTRAPSKVTWGILILKIPPFIPNCRHTASISSSRINCFCNLILIQIQLYNHCNYMTKQPFSCSFALDEYTLGCAVNSSLAVFFHSLTSFVVKLRISPLGKTRVCITPLL